MAGMPQTNSKILSSSVLIAVTLLAVFVGLAVVLRALRNAHLKLNLELGQHDSIGGK
jgi:hypothetical protein